MSVFTVRRSQGGFPVHHQSWYSSPWDPFSAYLVKILPWFSVNRKPTYNATIKKYSIYKVLEKRKGKPLSILRQGENIHSYCIRKVIGKCSYMYNRGGIVKEERPHSVTNVYFSVPRATVDIHLTLHSPYIPCCLSLQPAS